MMRNVIRESYRIEYEMCIRELDTMSSRTDIIIWGLSAPKSEAGVEREAISEHSVYNSVLCRVWLQNTLQAILQHTS